MPTPVAEYLNEGIVILNTTGVGVFLYAVGFFAVVFAIIETITHLTR
jgi:hypothetical protein